MTVRRRPVEAAGLGTEVGTRTGHGNPDRSGKRAGHSDRFAFGDNWLAFLDLVDEARIGTAADSLARALGTTDLAGRRFLDAGCGSGLFSLAAHRMGAEVRSFDLDNGSVAATEELRSRFRPGRPGWLIEAGSILDEDYVRGLGRYDIVYSWGVLHHTGAMWTALDTATGLVAPHGLLYVSIYNDQGVESRIWRRIKRRYNRSGPLTRALLVAGSAAYLARRRPARKLVELVRRNHDAAVSRAPRERGMSRRHDLVDWVGGHPFEVARPEQVFAFVRDRGFELRHLRTCGGGPGCNEYIFERTSSGPAER